MLTEDELLVLSELTQEDLDLANACLRVEAELRREQFEAVERLGALVAGGKGALVERVSALSATDRLDALRAVFDALWIDY